MMGKLGFLRNAVCSSGLIGVTENVCELIGESVPAIGAIAPYVPVL
jgi:hypothetical protein